MAIWRPWVDMPHDHACWKCTCALAGSLSSPLALLYSVVLFTYWSFRLQLYPVLQSLCDFHQWWSNSKYLKKLAIPPSPVWLQVWSVSIIYHIWLHIETGKALEEKEDYITVPTSSPSSPPATHTCKSFHLLGAVRRGRLAFRLEVRMVGFCNHRLLCDHFTSLGCSSSSIK